MAVALFCGVLGLVLLIRYTKTARMLRTLLAILWLHYLESNLSPLTSIH